MDRFRRRSRAGSAWAAVILILTGCAARYSGPWDLDELIKPPRVEWIEKTGPVRSLYYSGEPYHGRPTRVFAYYAVPAQADARGLSHDPASRPAGSRSHTGPGAGPRVPAMVLVHGGGGKAFREWAELWAARGYAAIAMDLAGHGPDGKRLPDGGPDQGHQEKFLDIEAGLKETWPYHVVANVIRAHSLLRTLPEVDPRRTGITGISWGGYLTCVVAGLDDRFRVAVPVYGCGFLYENSVWLDFFARLSPEQRQLWIDSFDPSRYLPGCRMPVLFVNGTNDFAYPLDSYQKSYRSVRGPRNLCVTVRMPHSHPDGWAPKEIGLFVDAVLGHGAPLPRFKQVSRSGLGITATFDAAVPITQAALHYATASGPWKEREWHSLPASLGHGEVTADLPRADGIVYFLTITDERGATVSTEHEELPPAA